MDGLPEAGQLIVGHLTGRIARLLVLAERFRQVTLPQLARRMFDQFTHVKLLGPVVRLIEILGHALEARTLSHPLPARSLVGRAAKELAVHETLGQDNRVSISRL